MPRKILPRIVAVAPGEQQMTLRVRWDNAEESLIDVSGMIQSFRVYALLRQSPELFRQVRVGEYGTDVVWTDEIDMAADALWRLAQEQAGETMTPDAFRHWRERKAYTLDEAARALGLSRRMVAYYEKGDRPIPRIVALATRPERWIWVPRDNLAYRADRSDDDRAFLNGITTKRTDKMRLPRKVLSPNHVRYARKSLSSERVRIIKPVPGSSLLR